ncbi:DUF11 domain-containing protein [Paenibacillus sp. SC116]|uniref:DUF11 domain-containing protein n=1 Tax=Paenibacillus sp. SC116 TaxID=2968986 RepID=UPI00215B714A|nr:DUF11 domain-containing protein [Paenibacillus sp. SC116]MCR8842655.1 DUF11 domain-containing protein [Paenibacillus sp. SC116]
MSDTPNVSILKEVDQTDAVVGDILTYTFTLANDSTVEVTNCKFKDVLSDEVKFVPNSVTIDGESQPGADPTQFITLEQLSIEGPITISFQVEVVKPHPSGVIKNKASMGSQYSGGYVDAVSNEVQVNVPAGRSACEWSRDLIIHSIAQEEKELATVLYIEGEKIQAAVNSFRAGRIPLIELLAVNHSAKTAVEHIANLEKELKNKLDKVKDLCCGC